MHRVSTWLKRTAASTAAVAVLAAGSAADAGHCGCYTKKMTTYITKWVPETSWRTYHDDCGKAYRVKVTVTRKVTVPVTKWVTVCP